VFSYWRVSPLEFIIWAAAVLVTIFSTIENGIYVSICASLALLLIRIAHPRGAFLGRVRVQLEGDDSKSQVRDVFVPLSTKKGIINSQVKVTPPPPGVLVYRYEESVLYPNCSHLNEVLVDYVKSNIRRGKDMSTVPLSDRPWNDPGPKRGTDPSIEREENERKPRLHAIVLDFSGVSQIDTTSIQALIDTRTEIERWTNRPVEVYNVLVDHEIALIDRLPHSSTLQPFFHLGFGEHWLLGALALVIASLRGLRKLHLLYHTAMGSGIPTQAGREIATSRRASKRIRLLKM
jgi:solute carrier family 26 (sodium-independent sulfate anion transporter), member 11